VVAEEANRYLTQMIHTPEVNRHMSATEFGGFNVETALPRVQQPVLHPQRTLRAHMPCRGSTS
jgi:hypothetical protein